MANSKNVDSKQEMCELVKQRTELLQKLSNLEKQIYNFETTYLEESAENGNIIKGFNKLLESTIGGVISGAALTSNLMTKAKRPLKRHLIESNRLFSLSSVTSPASLSMDISNDTSKLSDEQDTYRNGHQKIGELTNGEKITEVKPQPVMDGQNHTSSMDTNFGKRFRRSTIDD